MSRRILNLILGCASVCVGLTPMRAQEFKLFERTVQVHGFASQGFIYTNDNNWLTMNTSQGSAAFTDFGLNMSTQITDKFRIARRAMIAIWDNSANTILPWTGPSPTTVSRAGSGSGAAK